jgi:hypothetical protein
VFHIAQGVVWHGFVRVAMFSQILHAYEDEGMPHDMHRLENRSALARSGLPSRAQRAPTGPRPVAAGAAATRLRSRRRGTRG